MRERENGPVCIRMCFLVGAAGRSITVWAGSAWCPWLVVGGDSMVGLARAAAPVHEPDRETAHLSPELRRLWWAGCG